LIGVTPFEFMGKVYSNWSWN